MFKIKPYKMLTTLIIIIALSALQSPAFANSEIVAIVNDDPITNYDVEQRAKFMRLAKQTPLNNALRKAALEELIDERLKIQLARSSGVSIDRATADRQYASFARRSKLSTAQFSQMMQKNGVDPQTFKDRLAVMATWQKIVKQRFQRDIGNRREELQAEMEDRSDGPRSVEETEYQIAQVIIVIPEGDRAAATKGNALAKQLQKTYPNCDGLKNELKQHNTAIYKFIGWRRSSELPSSSIERIASLSDGQLSKPIKSSNGLDMAVICQRRTVESSGIIDKGLEQEVLDDELQTLARRMIRDMRQDAVITYR